MAVIGALGLAVVAASTIVDSISPARAASFARQPDTQVAVFLIPLSLVVLVLIFEVARFTWRGTPPAQEPRSPRPTDWALGSDAG